MKFFVKASKCTTPNYISSFLNFLTCSRTLWNVVKPPNVSSQVSVSSIEIGSSHLWSGTSSDRWSKNLLQYNYSAGVIAYNRALDKRLQDLRHHNVFLSDSYQESWNRATDPSSLVGQPNFYVHVPAQIDQSAAPAGESLDLSGWWRFHH
jgi:hypothetical protein